MKYFISIALSPEQYCIGIALTEWVTKWSKEYFISIALHSIALAHLHVIFNTNKILMQYCILLVLHYSIALASFFCLGTFEVQYIKYGWSYSNQTWTVSSSKGCSHFTDITRPRGWGGVKM